MNIQRIKIKSFKALEDVSFEPGKLNFFIGSNGAGKSTILEAIGVLSAAMTDRVDDNSLNRKGIRLSAPALYKSDFKDIERKAPTIGFEIEWNQNDNIYKYTVNLNVPKGDNKDSWRYHSEALYENQGKLWGRSGNTRKTLDSTVGMFAFEQNEELIKVRPMAEEFKNYGIYQPNTPTLRGSQSDPNQKNPIGLYGGRLAEAIEELIAKDEVGDIKIGNHDIEEFTELIDWAEGFNISSPKKSSINAAVSTSRRIIEFSDRYLDKNTRFTAYDASEGALYVLFLMALALHKDSPKVFAIDSFDHAMHPRLARAATKMFCELMLENDRSAFVITHNPLVLDGLNILDDRIRLFAVDRNNKNGHTSINRIKVTQEMLYSGRSLSRLWLEGRLGGVPNLL